MVLVKKEIAGFFMVGLDAISSAISDGASLGDDILKRCVFIALAFDWERHIAIGLQQVLVVEKIDVVIQAASGAVILNIAFVHDDIVGTLDMDTMCRPAKHRDILQHDPRVPAFIATAHQSPIGLARARAFKRKIFDDKIRDLR